MSWLLSLLPLRPAGAILARIFGPVWRWLAADWRNPLLAASGLIAAVHLLFVDPRLRAERAAAETARADAEAALDKQVADYREAYRAAFAKAWTAKQAEEARLSTLKEIADAQTTPLRAAALDRAGAYAERHRLDRLCPQAGADRGATGRAGVPRPAADPGRAESAAATAELAGGSPVAVTRADLDACTLNTIDLAIAHDWARSLEQGQPK